MQRTLVIVKPDAVGRGQIGDVIRCFQAKGFKITAMKMMQLTADQAKAFYRVHAERPFYNSLVEFMTSGPVVPICIEGADASVIDEVRALMGATNPAEAAEGTIRKLFAANIERNVVHGSDSPESAADEVPFFFSEVDFVNY